MSRKRLIVIIVSIVLLVPAIYLGYSYITRCYDCCNGMFSSCPAKDWDSPVSLFIKQAGEEDYRYTIYTDDIDYYDPDTMTFYLKENLEGYEFSMSDTYPNREIEQHRYTVDVDLYNSRYISATTWLMFLSTLPNPDEFDLTVTIYPESIEFSDSNRSGKFKSEQFVKAIVAAQLIQGDLEPSCNLVEGSYTCDFINKSLTIEGSDDAVR